MTNYIKSLQPAPRPGAKDKYQSVAIPELPPNPCAGGVRHGTADTIAMSVPAELAVHLTGHDLTNLSALWEYLRSRVALTIPGGITLTGFYPLPFGQTGEGPKHPSLQAVQDMGVSMLVLDAFIDELFDFNDGSPPCCYRSVCAYSRFLFLLSTQEPHHSPLTSHTLISGWPRSTHGVRDHRHYDHVL